jgi:ribonuclease BN (tRNA processing enzyme)
MTFDPLKNGEMSAEAYSKLVEIAGLTPNELRSRAYDHTTDTMEQLRKWKRGDLVALVFDSWLRRRAAENAQSDQKPSGATYVKSDPRIVTRKCCQQGPNVWGKIMKKLTFAGVGSAFCGTDQYQTNAVITVGEGDDEKHLLIDCGSDARFSLFPLGITLSRIDGVYISHLHADHVGGMEWLAFSTYFNPKLDRPKLFCDYSLMHKLWESTLRGGLDSIEGKVMTLTDYFDCQPIIPNGSFVWGDVVELTPVQTVHVMAGYQIVHSFGLMITLYEEEEFDTYASTDGECDGGSVSRYAKKKVFFTSDTQFCPHQIRKFYDEADLIFHDCETSPFKSGVHAHFDDLKTLPDEIKSKMWLMHYQWVEEVDLAKLAEDNGFAGFVRKGQSFDLTG